MRLDVDRLSAPGGDLVQEHPVAVVGDPQRDEVGVGDARGCDQLPGDRHESDMPGDDGVGLVGESMSRTRVRSACSPANTAR